MSEAAEHAVSEATEYAVSEATEYAVSEAGGAVRAGWRKLKQSGGQNENVGRRAGARKLAATGAV